MSKDDRSDLGARKPEPLRPVAVPNVTPLLAVLIVLLVTYLASLPAQKTLDETLPVERWTTRHIDGHCDNQIVLGYRADGAVNINKQEVRLDELDRRLRDIYTNRRCKEIYIAAAPDAPYGAVARLLDIAKGAGVTQIVMIPGWKGYDYFYR